MQGEVKKCPLCGKVFIVKNYHHRFCSRKCFFSDYNKKKKVYPYPVFVCQVCGKETQLNFHPITSRAKWLKFHCPYCGDSHGDSRKDFLIVREIRIGFRKEKKTCIDNV
jgi:predicted RNA-binding Zn-ribbon protein involved in translation (DUF1610 family)